MKKPGSMARFPLRISMLALSVRGGRQFADLIFELELAPLQFGDLEIIDGRMLGHFAEFLFDFPVLLLQFRKMGLQCHGQLSFH